MAPPARPRAGPSAIAVGAATCLGLVASQLLPAAAVRQRHCAAVQRDTDDPAFKPFLEADPLQPRQLPTAWVGALARWIKRIEAAPRSPRRPVIVQGEEDMTVDWQHNLQVLRSKFDQPEVLMLPRGRHHLANEIEEIREEHSAI